MSRSGGAQTGILSSALSKKDSRHQVHGLISSRMLRFASDRVYRVSSRWFAGDVFLCSVTLHVCQTKQFCAWHATSVTEFHPFQPGADRWVVLAAPDLFRLWPVSWRCPQLCPGSSLVKNVCYGLLGLALTTTCPLTACAH